MMGQGFRSISAITLAVTEHCIILLCLSPDLEGMQVEPRELLDLLSRSLVCL